MARIPLFLLEEHHEAYIAWNHAVLAGQLRRDGNSLLHVDEHEDCTGPRHLLNGPVPIGSPMPDVANFVYNQLRIGTFLVPTFYCCLFEEFSWMRRGTGTPGEPRRQFAYSPDGNGRELRITNNALKATCTDPKHRAVWCSRTGTDLDYTPQGPLVLDIDLDYFASVKQTPPCEIRVEVTRAEFRRLSSNPYHPLRTLASPVRRVWLEEDDNGCYLVQAHGNPGEPHPPTHAEIEERVDAFCRFLRRNKLQPTLINICRSRHSGFTLCPETVESCLLKTLAAIYDVEQIEISKIADPTVGWITRRQNGKKPRPPGTQGD